MGNETASGAVIEASRSVDRGYQLRDYRTKRDGRIFLTGTQAFVRMLLTQKRCDESAGLRTAGFVSGYRGSPLAAVDMEMWRAKQDLDQDQIRFLPAINEDMAATAIMGTQQVGLDPERTVDGVFAMWYGKGPGIDRSGDALRHGSAAGTSRRGGVLMVVGDDHAAVSSSIPHASDSSLMGWGIPIIHPSTIDEYVEFGLWGWAASRFSSTWVAFKAISETVESGRSIEAAPLPTFVEPDDFVSPVGPLEYRANDFLTPAIEVRLAAKLEAVKAFAALNSIDRLVTAAPSGEIGIIVVGKAWLDVMDALSRLGLSLSDLEECGIRIYRPGLVFPLEQTRAERFARGLKHILVVEEKASIVEQQLKDFIFNWSERPTVAGKKDLDGSDLIPWVGQLRPSLLAERIFRWLKRVAPGLGQLDVACIARPQALSNQADGMKRLPYFCSGCPHNTSTKVPEGSVALAGVGCHFMASWMDRSTAGQTQMGGEGADWVGHAPFTKTAHVFQNMGEGTYFHSGFLAIRQAIAARCTITYKILFNDAVAMTGGQPVDGSISVDQICRQVQTEGAKRVVVVTDQPNLYDGVDLAGVRVHHRHELDRIQRELRAIEGVTVLVYDQTCAAEKRRRRKKNTPERIVFPDPAKRLYIHPDVCEGCGDCGKKSNCLSIAPLETEFGRKRQIDQSSCNKDYSCVEGFCPSFVTVLGGSLRKSGLSIHQKEALERRLQQLPMPALPPLESPYDVMIAGVGGTGVITIGHILAVAAHLEDTWASVLDFTAMAQKGGSVLSHLRFARQAKQLNAVRVDWQQAKLVLVCDLLVGALPDVLGTIRRGTTRVVANTYLQTLAEFTRMPDLDDRARPLLDKLTHAAANNVEVLDAHQAVTSIFGDTATANVFILGYAWQKGLIPVSLAALDRSLELNNVAVADNKRAFGCGRLAAHDPAWLESLNNEGHLQLSASLDEVIERRRSLLVAYQNDRYAREYTDFVAQVRQKESAIAERPVDLPVTQAVARSLFKLMAYRDEYEVARLYSDPAFMASIKAQFEGDFKLAFNLAPPLLAKRDERGELIKREYGSWMLAGFRLLSRLKGLRGGPFDIFGYAAERKMERKLISQYKEQVQRMMRQLSPDNAALAAEICRLPDQIRGYGHIKEAQVRLYEVRLQELTRTYFVGA